MNTWTFEQYVDEFNDPTGESYVTTTITGIFSNGNISGSNVIVKLVCDLKDFQFVLYEHAQTPVSNPSNSTKNYSIKIKDESGTVHYFIGYLHSGASRIYLSPSQRASMFRLLEKNSVLKFSITFDMSHYNFTLNSEGFKDANNKLFASVYISAKQLMDSGKYEDAIELFKAMDGVLDSAEQMETCKTVIQERNYAAAEALMKQGKREEAIKIYKKMGNYLDAQEICAKLWKSITVPIAAGESHSLGLKSDGTVVATGENKRRQCNVDTWKDIVMIAANGDHSLGLKSDGTVVATGLNSDYQCDVDDWVDIVEIAAGYEFSLGLRFDGTVVATSDYAQCDVSEWTDIVAIAAGGFHSLGLKSDGTVVATGWNEHGQCNVSDWTDIVAIAAGSRHSLGLKSDGTVVATKFINDQEDNYGQCDVSDWTDIVAIAAGFYHSLGLKSDGTVVAMGENERGQCNIDNWRDVVAIAAGVSHSLGLKSDGTVVATKFIESEYIKDAGRSEVNKWESILVPSKD